MFVPPIFHLLFVIESFNERSSLTISNISLVLLTSFSLSFSFVSNTISQMFLVFFFSFFFIIHNSQPYITMFKTYALISLFLILMINFLDVNNFGFLLNTVFTIPFHIFISLMSFLSHIILLLKYGNSLTGFSLYLSNYISTTIV